MAKKKSAKTAAQKAVTKKVAVKGKRAAKRRSKCTTPPYCELYCSSSLWYLVNENHETGYVCPTTLGVDRPGFACPPGTYSCSAPTPRIVLSTSRDVPLNTGDYVLVETGTLQIIRGHCDVEHYCPNELTIEEYAARGREERRLSRIITKVRDHDRLLSITVNIDALERDRVSVKKSRPRG